VESAGPAVGAKFEELVAYLRTAPPANDYQRTLLLWAASRYPDLLEKDRIEALQAMIRSHQREDGGWSIRRFASPETWGSGNRAEKLRAEPEFGEPPSDGHMTGLAIIVLREAGAPVDDPQITKAIRWLKANQRESGRWWTRSLNTDKHHLITYSGTAYPMLALSLCGELTQPTAD
jgi:squalene-hopene/tetraprenyl-beta-curcumene cyclase